MQEVDIEFTTETTEIPDEVMEQNTGDQEVIEITLKQQLRFNGGWFEEGDIIEVTEGQLQILDAMGVDYT